MALNDPKVSNINGTTDDSLRIADAAINGGIASANTLAVQNVGGLAKLFKADGSTRAELEVATTPTTNNSAASKSYVDSLVGPVAYSEEVFGTTIGFATAPGNIDSTKLVPQGSKITSVDFFVTTAFTGGTGPHTLTVGYAGSGPNATKFAKTSDSNLAVKGAYTVGQYTPNDTPDAPGAPVRIVLANGGTPPAAGSVDVVIKYVKTPAWT